VTPSFWKGFVIGLALVAPFWLLVAAGMVWWLA